MKNGFLFLFIITLISCNEVKPPTDSNEKDSVTDTAKQSNSTLDMKNTHLFRFLKANTILDTTAVGLEGSIWIKDAAIDYPFDLYVSDILDSQKNYHIKLKSKQDFKVGLIEPGNYSFLLMDGTDTVASSFKAMKSGEMYAVFIKR